MPHVRLPHRAPLGRPPVPNQGIHSRPPVSRAPMQRVATPYHAGAPVRNRVPQYLPVLQPPIFPNQNEFYDDEQQDQYSADFYLYPTVSLAEHDGAMNQSFAYRSRFMSTLQRFYTQPFARFSHFYTGYFEGNY